MMWSVRRLKASLVEYIALKVLWPMQARWGGCQVPEVEALRGQRKILLTLVPTHGNLGDHAIAFATRAFLEDCFPDYAVVEVALRDVYRLMPSLKRAFGPDDLVLLLGGGNTGDLYRHEEWTRRFLVRQFQDLPMVSLPQTAHFTDSRRGRRELQAARRTYAGHRRFLFLARDPTTLAFMRREMPEVRTTYQPDMVLYVDASAPRRTRSGVAVCLRQDKESALGAVARSSIMATLAGEFGEVTTFDTIAPHDVDATTRGAELAGLWSHLRGVSVAVTDRLHGLMFCYITRTPCVAVRSFDNKVIDAFKALDGQQNFLFLAEEPTPEAIAQQVRRALAVEQVTTEDVRARWFSELRPLVLSAVASLGGRP